MSDTTTAGLLAIAKEAYASALKSASLTHGDRTKVNQQIEKLHGEITWLENKLSNETRAAAGQNAPRVLVADFSRGLGR